MANSYVRWPSAGQGVNAYANYAALPAVATDGTVATTTDTDSAYIYDAGTTTWKLLASASGGVITIGTINSQTKSANGAVESGNVLYFQTADATYPGLVSTGTQTMAGAKTWSGAAVFSSTINGNTLTTGTGTLTLSTFTLTVTAAASVGGSNTGDVTIGTASGLSLVGQALSLGLASAGVTGALSGTDWSTFNGKQAAGNYITALTGDGTASGPGSVALTLATVNSNVGSFGSASSVATFTVNGKGLLTAAASTSIQIAESQVTNLTSDLALKAPLASPTFTGTVTTPALTLSTFTLGSVLFASTGGAVAQDNAEFFWNDTDNKLYIGSTSPVGTPGKLHVVVKSTEALTAVIADRYAGGAIYIGRRANGTVGTPTKVLSGEDMARFSGGGYQETTGGFLGSIAGMNVTAAEDLGNANRGAYLRWFTTPIATSSTNTADMSLYNGLLSLNAGGTASAVPAASLEVIGNSTITGAGSSNFARYGGQPTHVMRRANGTQASPTKLLLDQVIGSVNGQGYQETTGAFTGTKAVWEMYAGEDFTSTANGTYQKWSVTPNTGTTLQEAMRLIPLATGSNALRIVSTAAGVAGTAQSALQFYGTNTGATAKEHARIAGSPGVASTDAGQLIFYTNDSSSVLQSRALFNEAGLLIFSDTTKGIKGTISVNDAAAGVVGEVVRSYQAGGGSAVSLTTATAKTVTSISLTAGDWDVTGFCGFQGTLTGTQLIAAIGLTNNSLSGAVYGDNASQTPTMPTVNADVYLDIPVYRISISATTTVYLVVNATFTVGAAGAYGRLSARRVR